jgi:NhaP-type Na+/H+ or K+/H+ antiporter
MHEASEHVFFLLLLSLTFTVILYEVKKKVGIPVAPLLLLSGIVTGIVSESPALGHWFLIWRGIDYEIVELVFLPGLIFETALTLDWYLFKRYVYLIGLLATACVLMTWVLSSFMIYSLYDWDMKHAFILGTVLTATDHVAVVAQLRELHAERRFALILQGETLLNEALVFVLLQDALNEHSETQSIKLFFKLFLGGIGLGLAMSFIIHQLLKRVINDAIQETTLLLVSCYILFFVNEKLECSGATSVAIFGIYMSAYGKTSISASVEHEVHLIWQFFTQAIEAMVFFLSGVIVGLILRDREIEGQDVWKLVCLVLYTLVVRVVVVLLLFPLMHKIKQTYRWREAAVLSLAGVKGVISIVFGLVVYHSKIPNKMAAEVLFLTVCVSTCSIFISHYAVRLAVHLLGLSSYSKPEAISIAHSVYEMFEEIEKEMNTLKQEPQYAEVNWDGVMELLTPNILLEDLVKQPSFVPRPRTDTSQELLSLVQAAGSLDSIDDLIFTRRKFVLFYRRMYWHEYEMGQCFPMSIVQLDNAASRSLELISTKLVEWDYIQEDLLHGFVPRMVSCLAAKRAVGWLLHSTEQNQLQNAFDVASTFLVVQRKAVETFKKEAEWAPEKVEEIITESVKQQRLCEAFLVDNFSHLKKEIKESVQSKKACFAVLMAIRQKIEEAYETGRIGEEYFARMIAGVDRKVKSLDKTVAELVALPTMQPTMSLIGDEGL